MNPRLVGAEDVFVPPLRPARETLPLKPIHRYLISTDTPTPAGQPNPYADRLNHFLGMALQNKLNLTELGQGKQANEVPEFMQVALWGLLSADSKFREREEWIALLQTGIDKALEDFREADDEKGRPAGIIGPEMTLPLYSTAMVELDGRTELIERIGVDRVRQYRDMIVHSIRWTVDDARWQKHRQTAVGWFNLLTHVIMPVIHGWVLTEEPKFLAMATDVINQEVDLQLPNGMIPYVPYGPFEMMYYHAVDVRTLYLYWWYTGSEVAAGGLKKAVPYYPLNIEPPYHWNDGPTIWWKLAWRTFWPAQIAMTAVAAGDGENAEIARQFARDNVSIDHYDALLNAQAFQELACRNIVSKPVRDRYVVQDPDLRDGLRLRYAPWSCTFSTGSSTVTRASCMVTHWEEGKASTYDAMILARPVIWFSDPKQTEPDYSTMPPSEVLGVTWAGDRVGLAATNYSPMLTSRTWDIPKITGAWNCAELWLMTDRAMVGLIDSEAMAPQAMRELAHEFRFFGPGSTGVADGDRQWRYGRLGFHVWATDMEQVHVESAPLSLLNAKNTPAWQVCLSDVQRSSRPMLMADERDKDCVVPPLRIVTTPYRRFSLVSVEPQGDAVAVTQVQRIGVNPLAFEAAIGGRTYLVYFNQTHRPVKVEPGADVKLIHATAAGHPEYQWDQKTLAMPAHSAAVMMRQ
ncbi:MAG: hypothetical protein IT440_09975 [Phycisphaeraceae bacterium]|nr:hypothetical protein [Phycisphaeraceae bacterium]